MTWIAVALGGAVGSAARHAVNVAFSHLGEGATPYATATVNIIGSLVIDVLAGLAASGRLHMAPHVRAFVFVGILGGFTTFSSFMLDTLTLSHGPERGLAVANVLAQVVIGTIAVFAGYAAAR
jgi:fluoride exporter